MIENLLNQLQQIAKDSENDRCFLAISADGCGIVWTKDDVVCEFDNLEQLVSRLAQATKDFTCPLCYKSCETRAGHSECHDYENFISDMQSQAMLEARVES